VELLDKLGSFGSQAEAYWELASTYRDIGSYSAAKRYASKALNIYDAQNNVLLIAQMEGSYGLILLKEGNVDEAERYLTHSLELCEGLKMDCDTVLSLNNLLRVSLERGDLETATERATKAVELGRAALRDSEASRAEQGRRTYVQSVASARRALAGALSLSGEVATAKGNDKEADKLFSEAIEIIEAESPEGSSGEIYQRYAQVLAGRGQHEKASKYFERAYQSVAGKA
jgi:tetratricopeptide (TPR) repeat protein